MAEPPKRTNLRSSPEDAAFYRQFHDHALAALRQGAPREQLLQELVGNGVPEKTAARIVIAVEQELALANPARSGSPRGVGKVLGFIALVWGAVAGYLVWQMTKGGTFQWKYLVAAGVIAVYLTIRIASRLLLRRKEPADLPSPPDPGGR
jgi:hypothetical protein